jgi:hypothetical protein
MTRDVNHATLGEYFNSTDGRNYKVTQLKLNTTAEYIKL